MIQRLGTGILKEIDVNSRMGVNIFLSFSSEETKLSQWHISNGSVLPLRRKKAEIL